MVKRITNDAYVCHGEVPYSVFYRGMKKSGYSSGSWQERFEKRLAQEKQLVGQKAKPKRKRRTRRIP